MECVTGVVAPKTRASFLTRPFKSPSRVRRCNFLYMQHTRSWFCFELGLLMGVALGVMGRVASKPSAAAELVDQPAAVF